MAFISTFSLALPLDLALKDMDRDRLVAKLRESLSAIHKLDVVHKDPTPRNWSYNPESKNLVVFDFERAERGSPGSGREAGPGSSTTASQASRSDGRVCVVW
jgi:hypothetical protein